MSIDEAMQLREPNVDREREAVAIEGMIIWYRIRTVYQLHQKRFTQSYKERERERKIHILKIDHIGREEKEAGPGAGNSIPPPPRSANFASSRSAS